jgi:hypothetical protein
MSWLGLNGSSREDFASLTDAYNSMYQAAEKSEEIEEVEKEEPQQLSEEGKKDACYNKVKSRYDVWPSAYASGALVKCRQKGAKNWGNSSKKEAFDLAVGEMMQEGIDFSDTYEEDAFDAFLFGWEELQEARDKTDMELYSSLGDAYNMMYEKKKDSDKCGEDTYWDKEEKKCKSKKKSSKTVVVGRGGIYGPGYHGGGGGSNGDGDGDGDGGDSGGGDGGGGGE